MCYPAKLLLNSNTSDIGRSYCLFLTFCAASSNDADRRFWLQGTRSPAYDS